jgi:hypothetical protein
MENRLSAEQLAGLTSGDSVTIESGAEVSRRRYRTGRVVRVDPSHIIVNAPGPKGGTFIECYSRRDGVRVGGLGRAELVEDAELIRGGVQKLVLKLLRLDLRTTDQWNPSQRLRLARLLADEERPTCTH